MLGERLAVESAQRGDSPGYRIPSDLGHLSNLERAAEYALGDEAWRFWVARGWLSVQCW
jgi:hypothetical protein